MSESEVFRQADRLYLSVMPQTEAGKALKEAIHAVWSKPAGDQTVWAAYETAFATFVREYGAHVPTFDVETLKHIASYEFGHDYVDQPRHFDEDWKPASPAPMPRSAR